MDIYSKYIYVHIKCVIYAPNEYFKIIIPLKYTLQWKSEKI